MNVIAAQADLAQRQSDLRQRQLVAEVIRPAEAEAQKVEILAKADAQRVRMQAEAAASNNRIALDRMLIDQLPQIVKEAAGGLAGANINVLNGADGLGEIAAGLVAQGLTILDSVKKNLSATPDEPVSAYDAIPPAPDGAVGDRTAANSSPNSGM
jgi:flotillin